MIKRFFKWLGSFIDKTKPENGVINFDIQPTFHFDPWKEGVNYSSEPIKPIETKEFKEESNRLTNQSIATKPKPAPPPIAPPLVKVNSKKCYERFGDPSKESSMILWDVPAMLEIGVLPNRVYCNKQLVKPLTDAFQNIILRGLINEVRTWDGCFNIRKKKGGTTSSLHSWGMAIDINAAWNGFGKNPTMSNALVKCFTDAGFEWGGKWSTPDAMHFQLKYFEE